MDFYCLFVHTGPDATAHRDDSLSLFMTEGTIRESNREQAAAHSLQKLKSLKGRWGYFLSWRESIQF